MRFVLLATILSCHHAARERPGKSRGRCLAPAWNRQDRRIYWQLLATTWVE
jgi:hypothetical protein